MDTYTARTLMEHALQLYTIHSKSGNAEDAAYYLGYAHAFEDWLAVERGELSWKDIAEGLRRRMSRVTPS